jgi:hypothetical protein
MNMGHLRLHLHRYPKASAAEADGKWSPELSALRQEELVIFHLKAFGEIPHKCITLYVSGPRKRWQRIQAPAY